LYEFITFTGYYIDSRKAESLEFEDTGHWSLGIGHWSFVLPNCLLPTGKGFRVQSLESRGQRAGGKGQRAEVGNQKSEGNLQSLFVIR